MRSRALALLPTASLAILVFWSGSFHGAATAAGSLVTTLLLFLLFGLTAPSLADPLGLGRGWRWLPVVALTLTWISCWQSPVARAGLLPAVLLPVLLVLPAAVATCWSTAARLRMGLRSIAILYLAVAGVALLLWQVRALARTSLPLGHHNLLAMWLILLLPLAVANGLRAGLDRWLAMAAAATGIAALVATGSLLGSLALGFELVLIAILWAPTRRWLLPVAVLAGLLATPRLLDIAQRVDPSALARSGYFEAGWRGIAARPWLGWGPGATPWTIAEFMRPTAGVHPASEVIGDLHSMPLQIGYETGMLCLAVTLTIVLVFAHRRWRESILASAGGTTRAALVGIAGGLLFGLGAAPLSVPVLPATFGLLAGAALAEHHSVDRRTIGVRVPLATLLIGVLLLAPAFGAHRLYDRARRAADPAVAIDLLARAEQLDPHFPLYPARRAWLIGEHDRSDPAAADLALSAARLGWGSAPLWLAAGSLGLDSGRDWAGEALDRALELDPLSPMAAFLLLQTLPDGPRAMDLAVRSLAGDARLARARWWEDRSELAASVAERTGLEIADLTVGAGEARVLAVTVDRSPATSFSLYAFRRCPWPASLAAIRIAAE